MAEPRRGMTADDFQFRDALLGMQLASAERRDAELSATTAQRALTDAELQASDDVQDRIAELRAEIRENRMDAYRAALAENPGHTRHCFCEDAPDPRCCWCGIPRSFLVADAA